MRLSDRNLSRTLLMHVLRGAVKFAMRHGVRLPDFIESAKALFVEVARKDLEQQNAKPNVSKISVMSGVHRKDVQRLMESRAPAQGQGDLITKIIGMWRTDKRFTTKNGTPRVLTYKSADSEFSKLVSSVSQDVNPGTVFFELSRTEAVTVTRDGLKLLVQSFVPKGDTEAGFKILSADYEDLARCVSENMLEDPSIPQLHARTEYDNVRPDSIQEIKQMLLKDGHESHARIRSYLSALDQDINPDPRFKGKGIRVVFSSFSFVEDKKGKK